MVKYLKLFFFTFITFSVKILLCFMLKKKKFTDSFDLRVVFDKNVK